MMKRVNSLAVVLINFSEEPVSDYSLSLSEGPFVGESVPDLLFGSADPASLNANEAGGFDAYKPIETLPPQSSFILQV